MGIMERIKDVMLDRLSSYGIAIATGVFIGSAMSSGTVLGVTLYTLSKRDMLNRIPDQIQSFVQKTIGVNTGGSNGVDAATESLYQRIEKLEARVAEMETLAAAGQYSVGSVVKSDSSETIASAIYS